MHLENLSMLGNGFIDLNIPLICRLFNHFRYTKTGQLAVAGFSDPINDPSKDDLKVWNFESDNSSKDLDVMQARYLLCKVADLFCNLYNQEKKAVEINEGRIFE